MSFGESAAVPLIEASGIHAHYGASHVLHGVDFVLRPGETLALMGRNGMGKTTLLKTVLGLVPATQGRVRIKGEDCTGAPVHRIARQGIAYVPEGRGIFPGLSVREHLVMAERPAQRGRAAWTLERVFATFPRLAERINHAGERLSGGEQQMLSIARALVTNPDALILDEATEGLAPLMAREVWRVVKDIKATGMATVIVDKNFAAVSANSDRAVILVKGSVVYEGSSAELRASTELHLKHLGV